MGNNTSTVDPVHLRIYSNIIQITDPIKRVQIINTCLASIEYVNSAKRGGVYSYLLNYISTVNSGGNPPLLPGEHQQTLPQQPQYNTTIPRTLQQPYYHSGPGATHPSLLNAPNASTYVQPSKQNTSQLTIHSDNAPSWKVITETPKQKAISYFASCLEVLNIQEEVALTEDSLKKAYKKAALKAHPDKGGSEEYFEAVTRAYAYLSEILKYMSSGKRTTSNLDNINTIHSNRDTEAKQWEYKSDPIRLNPKNLDMNAFNKMFEQTHMPDPDSDGYGDWLKNNTQNDNTPKFKGKFNRDVFNRMFDDESKKSQTQSNNLIIHPGQMALTLNPTNGVDLVMDRPSSFTAAPNSKFQYTDLRGAYTTDNTVSDKVSNVQVTERNYEQYRANREKAPDPFTQTELHSIRDFEQRQKSADELRERKRAEMAVRNQQYFDKMKQLVITDGATNLNQGKLTY